MQMLDILKSRLQDLDNGLIDAGNIGVPRPTGVADLPAITLWAEGISEMSIGVGDVIEIETVSENQVRETTAIKRTALVNIEIWARTDEQSVNISNAVEQFLWASKANLRLSGFIDFKLREMHPREARKLGNANVPRSVLAVLSYHVVFEEMVIEDIGPGGIIGEIQVVFEDDADVPAVIR